MSQSLPARADLDWYRKAAKKTLRSLRAKKPDAMLVDAQRAVARAHGFSSWPKLKQNIESSKGAAANADAAKFIAAITAADIAAMAQMLKSSPALANARDADNAPALLVAVERDNAAMVRLLLDHGADVTARYGRSAHTPLSWAMTLGALKAAEALLKAGVKPDLFCAAGLNAVKMLPEFFNADGYAIDGSSQTGSSRYGADGALLPSPPADAIERASDALYVACRNARVEAVRFLLTQRVDLNFRAYDGGTPLHWGYFSGSKEVVRMLLAAGADPAARDHVLHATPRVFGICVPARWGHMTQLKRVLRSDPSAVNLLEARGTPLHEAARGGHLGIAKALLKAGADPSIQDGEGKTPADIAAAGGHGELAKLLSPPRIAASDAFIDALPPKRRGHKIAQWKPIMDAAFAGHAARIKKLLTAGVDPNVVSTTAAHYRPLHRAIERKRLTDRHAGHEAAVKALLDGGADPHLRGGSSRLTALQLSAVGKIQFVPLLRDRFEPLDLFHASALAEDRRVMALLKRDPALARAADGNGWTALHYAAASAFHKQPAGAAALLRIARALLDAGADVSAAWNYEDAWPLRPIYYASGYSNFSAMAKLLLDAGADPCDNESVYHASDEGHAECLALFEQYVTQKKLAEECTKCLATQLHWGHSRGAAWLLAHGADPNALHPKYGYSGLHAAAERGAGEAIIAMLLWHGADPAAKSTAGETAIAIAKKAKKQRVVEQLTAWKSRAL